MSIDYIHKVLNNTFWFVVNCLINCLISITFHVNLSGKLIHEHALVLSREDALAGLS